MNLERSRSNLRTRPIKHKSPPGRNGAKTSTPRSPGRAKRSEPGRRSGVNRVRTSGTVKASLERIGKQIRKPWEKIDSTFLTLLTLLVIIGLLMVYSASMYSAINAGESGSSSLIKQLFFASLGFVIMILVSRIDFSEFSDLRFVRILFWGTALLLALTLVIGVNVNGARRWIEIPGIGSFQPSELAKVAVILYISAMISHYPKSLKTFWGFFFVYVLPVLLICGLTIIEPSMSATIAIFVGGAIVLWIGGTNILHILLMFAGVGSAGLIFLLIEPWRISRVLQFFGETRLGYQIRQSLVAFGSGGLFGVGLGKGKQKLLFLPELQNDFIFANIGEEFGLFGCLAVITVYCLFIFRGYQIAKAIKKKSLFGYLYTMGVIGLLFFQMFINIGVAINALPVTGMALPFISYGGTSMLVLLFMIAPIMNMSRQVELPSLFSAFTKTVGQKREIRKQKA